MNEILERPAKILSQRQRKAYFQDGFIGVEGLVGEPWLSKLQAVTKHFIELSRTVEGKDKRFDLEATHSPEEPRIRRLNSPTDFHETYWEFASQGPFVDVAEDLLGANVKFHHSKLNFKWSGGGEEVKWHQDIQFWPHTNYQVLTLGVYLDDVTDDMSPMGVIPHSHNGPLYNLYDDSGRWTGALNDEDISGLDVESAVYLGGSAGSITAHNCRCVHGSAPNRAAKPRPLLLCAYSAAHAIPITNLTANGKHAEVIVRGQPAKWAEFDPRPVLLPPDWSKTGYKSIFEHQQGEI